MPCPYLRCKHGKGRGGAVVRRSGVMGFGRHGWFIRTSPPVRGNVRFLQVSAPGCGIVPALPVYWLNVLLFALCRTGRSSGPDSMVTNNSSVDAFGQVCAALHTP